VGTATEREVTVTRNFGATGAVLVFLLVANVSSVHAHQSAPLKTIVLRPTDLPPGFTLSANKADSRPSLSNVPIGHLASTTYETELIHDFSTGIQDVDQVVTEFRRVADAHRYYMRATTSQPSRDPGCSWLPTGSIGEVRVGSRCNGRLKGSHLTLDSIWFCLGPYFVFPAVAGTFNSFPRSRIVHFAQIP
jgi:hypothetical protein